MANFNGSLILDEILKITFLCLVIGELAAYLSYGNTLPMLMDVYVRANAFLPNQDYKILIKIFEDSLLYTDIIQHGSKQYKLKYYVEPYCVKQSFPDNVEVDKILFNENILYIFLTYILLTLPIKLEAYV